MAAALLKGHRRPEDIGFNGERAYKDVLAQVAFGPRTGGSQAHDKAVEYIKNELINAGWQVTIQRATIMGHEVENVIAERSAQEPTILLGAHYDTRLIAERDSDPLRQSQAGPGANDGASGVAVLLELARTIPKDAPPLEMAFFDAEDNGNIPGWDWILGSRAFVSSMQHNPKAMILVDMVGDKDLTLPMERNSDPILTRSIWETARSLGYEDIFLSRPGMQILDDHVPFIESGIPSVDIIDINYPYWHTSQDTLDKISADSLQAVGSTLLEWINQHKP